MRGMEHAQEAPVSVQGLGGPELDGPQENALQGDANLLAQLPIASALASLNSAEGCAAHGAGLFPNSVANSGSNYCPAANSGTEGVQIAGWGD